MTLNLRMNQFPVPIERLEKEFGQPVVENERPQPEAKEHCLHDILGYLRSVAELNFELQVLESRSHLPLCIAFGSGRLP
jgi:hypothetical protein